MSDARSIITTFGVFGIIALATTAFLRLGEAVGHEVEKPFAKLEEVAVRVKLLEDSRADMWQNEQMVLLSQRINALEELIAQMEAGK